MDAAEREPHPSFVLARRGWMVHLEGITQHKHDNLKRLATALSHLGLCPDLSIFNVSEHL